MRYAVAIALLAVASLVWASSHATVGERQTYAVTLWGLEKGDGLAVDFGCNVDVVWVVAQNMSVTVNGTCVTMVVTEDMPKDVCYVVVVKEAR